MVVGSRQAIDYSSITKPSRVRGSGYGMKAESSYSICNLKGSVEYSVFIQNTYKDNGDRCLPTSYEDLTFNLQVSSGL